MSVGQDVDSRSYYLSTIPGPIYQPSLARFINHPRPLLSKEGESYTPITALTSHMTMGTVMAKTPIMSMIMPDFIIFVMGTMPEA